MYDKKGGAYVAAGTYGCVYAPNVPSPKFARSSQYISKVIKAHHEKAELKEVQRLRLPQIDPRSDYLIYPIASERFSEVGTEENDFTECFLLDNEIDRLRKRGFNKAQILNYLSQKYKNLIQSNGGPSLSVLLDDLLNRNSITHADVSKMLVGYWNLFQGLVLLYSNGICHRDIKNDNMTTEPTFRFIDFGLAVSIQSDFATDDHQGFSEASYEVWPMDYMVQVRQIHRRITDPDTQIPQAAAELAAEYLKSKRFDPYRANMTKQLADYIRFLYRFQDIDYGYLSLEKLDVYSLGVAMIPFIRYIDIHDQSEVGQALDAVYALIVKMIHGNPNKRITAIDAAKEYWNATKTVLAQAGFQESTELAKIDRLSRPVIKGGAKRLYLVK